MKMGATFLLRYHVWEEIPLIGGTCSDGRKYRKPCMFTIILFRVSQAPRLDLDKLYEEITLDVLYHNDYRPQTASSPQKKDNSSSR